jgi:hypothetical protein
MSEIANWQSISGTFTSADGSAVALNGSFDWVSSAKGRILNPAHAPTVTFVLNTVSGYYGAWGLSYNTSNAFSTQLPFCWSRKDAETYKVRENGTVVFDSGSTDNTKPLAIKIETSGAVKYYRDGVLVYTSANTVSGLIYIKATGGFYTFDPTFTTGSGVYDAKLNSAVIAADAAFQEGGTDEVDLILNQLAAGENFQASFQDRDFADDADVSLYTNNIVGLAYYPHQRSYEGSPLASVTNSIIQFRVMRSGFIRNAYLWLKEVTGSGTSYYNIRKNGVVLWTGADRLAVTSGSFAPSKENLSIAVVRGDLIILDLEQYAAGQIHYGPITVLVETQ